MNPTPISGLSTILSVFTILTVRTASALRINKLFRALISHFSCPILLSQFAAAMILAIVMLITLTITLGVTVSSPGPRLAYGATALLTPARSCVTVASRPIGRSVIFRFDDVHANFHTDASLTIMNLAEANGVPLVLGVIPKNILSDPGLLSHLRSKHCFHEVAVHGWDHLPITTAEDVYAEFAILNEAKTLRRLSRAERVITERVGTTVVTFIPPEGVISTDAVRAVRKYGFSVVSTNQDAFYDLDADIWNYQTNEFASASSVLNRCENVFENGDELCTIVLHPQDFVDENDRIVEERIAELNKMFSFYSNSDAYQVTTFRDHQISLRQLTSNVE